MMETDRSSKEQHEGVVRSLIRPCQEADTCEDLTYRLKELKLTMKSYGSSCHDEEEGEDEEMVRIWKVRKTLVLHLLRDLSDNIALLDTTNTRTTRTTLQVELDECLVQSGSHALVSAAREILMEHAGASQSTLFTLQQTLRCLKRLVLLAENDTTKYNATETLYIEPPAANFMDMFLGDLLSLPVLIANACHCQRIQLPKWAVRGQYMERLVESAFVNTSGANEDYVTALLHKIIHKGHGFQVAVGIRNAYSYYEANLDQNFQIRIRRLVDATLRDSLPRNAAALLRSMVQESLARHGDDDDDDDTVIEDSLPYWRITCLPILNRSPNVRKHWVRLMVFSSVVSKEEATCRRQCDAVTTLLSECKEAQQHVESDDDEDSLSSADDGTCKESVLHRTVRQVASQWALSVQQMDPQLQHHVTLFLASGLRLLSNEDQNSAPSRLDESVMFGVTNRLGASHAGVRKDGMRIGELIAKRRGETLHFQELQDERRTNDEPARESHDIEKLPAAGEALAINKMSRRQRSARKKSVKVVDPDAPFISDSDESSVEEDDILSEPNHVDSDSVWSDELRPYDLDDDEEDLRTVPTPLYLRQCLDLLNTPDTEETAYECRDAALKAICGLVRSRPADLSDLAVPLAMKLARMEDTFRMKDFDQDVQAGLLSLTVTDPLSVGEYLINNEFFANVGLKSRMDILLVLARAVRELCGEKALAEMHSERAAHSDASIVASRVTGKRNFVQAGEDGSISAAEARTRRWGRAGRKRDYSVRVMNSFSPVASAWFYLLVGGFMKRKDDATLWGGANGAKVLAYLLLLLGTIVSRAGYYSGAGILATDLIEISFLFRTVEDSGIRAAVLVALDDSLSVLRDDALVEALFGRWGSIPGYLAGAAREDPDDTCRYLAGTLSTRIAETIGTAAIE